MSDKLYYHEDNQASVLRGWVLAQMLRGAGWAALGVCCWIVIYLVMLGLASALPEESKQAPSPYLSFEHSVVDVTALA